MKQFKITVCVMTPYSTIVEANTEEEAEQIALEREAPTLLIHYDEVREYEWSSEGLDEFPNLGKNETPCIEEL